MRSRRVLLIGSPVVCAAKVCPERAVCIAMVLDSMPGAPIVSSSGTVLLLLSMLRIRVGGLSEGANEACDCLAGQRCMPTHRVGAANEIADGEKLHLHLEERYITVYKVARAARLTCKAAAAGTSPTASSRLPLCRSRAPGTPWTPRATTQVRLSQQVLQTTPWCCC